MRIVAFSFDGQHGIAARTRDCALRGVLASDDRYPGGLQVLLTMDQADRQAIHAMLERSPLLDEKAIGYLPPISRPPKVICVGLNYADHTKESHYQQPSYPTLFGRFSVTLVGHQAALIRPTVSEMLDYEGEMAVIIGRAGRHVQRRDALGYIAGYSVFNDATVRDYARKTTQWTVGKNFFGTGAFGPDFVSADELPPGGSGLAIATRVNGTTVQSANTREMIFDVQDLIATISEVMPLEIGDVIVTGTPAGMGAARTPPLFLFNGDRCEVEVEGIGTLVNMVADEMSAAPAPMSVN